MSGRHEYVGDECGVCRTCGLGHVEHDRAQKRLPVWGRTWPETDAEREADEKHHMGYYEANPR